MPTFVVILAKQTEVWNGWHVEVYIVAVGWDNRVYHPPARE